jgi:hypothetical protein
MRMKPRLDAGLIFRMKGAKSKDAPLKLFLKKVKEGVDSLSSLYIFTNPSRDSGH